MGANISGQGKQHSIPIKIKKGEEDKFIFTTKSAPPKKQGKASLGVYLDESDGKVKIVDLVEKPDPAQAPSDLAVIGRYILTPAIFRYLEVTKPGRGGEIQLTDAMCMMLENHGMFGLRFAGKRYDIGNKLDFLKTNIEFGLKRDDIGPKLAEYLKRIVADLD